MADSFAGGLAQGLDSLLPSIRAERERKAQEKFKLDLYNDEKNNVNEIRRLATKQRALEVFGQGVAQIQQTYHKQTLDSLVGKHGGSQQLSAYIQDLDKKTEKVDKEIARIQDKLEDAYLKTTMINVTPEKKNGLNDFDSGKPTPKEIIDIQKTPYYQDMKSKLDYLESTKMALVNSREESLKKLNAGSSKLTKDAENVKRSFTIDDALATREAEVLKESLGLTDEDIARFKIKKGGGNPKALDSYFTSDAQDYSPVSIQPNFENLLQEKEKAQGQPVAEENIFKIKELSDKMDAITGQAPSEFDFLTEQDMATINQNPILVQKLNEKGEKLRQRGLSAFSEIQRGATGARKLGVDAPNEPLKNVNFLHSLVSKLELDPREIEALQVNRPINGKLFGLSRLLDNVLSPQGLDAYTQESSRIEEDYAKRVAPYYSGQQQRLFPQEQVKESVKSLDNETRLRRDTGYNLSYLFNTLKSGGQYKYEPYADPKDAYLQSIQQSGNK